MSIRRPDGWPLRPTERSSLRVLLGTSWYIAGDYCRREVDRASHLIDDVSTSLTKAQVRLSRHLAGTGASTHLPLMPIDFL